MITLSNFVISEKPRFLLVSYHYHNDFYPALWQGSACPWSESTHTACTVKVPCKRESPPVGNRTRRTACSVTCPGGGEYPSPGWRGTPVLPRGYPSSGSGRGYPSPGRGYLSLAWRGTAVLTRAGGTQCWPSLGGTGNLTEVPPPGVNRLKTLPWLILRMWAVTKYEWKIFLHWKIRWVPLTMSSVTSSRLQ